MKTLAIIPARCASTRLIGKPLRDICGKSMIQRVYERVAPFVDVAYVATDSTAVMAEVLKFKGKSILVAEKCENGTSRCYWAMMQIMEDSTYFDLIINVQGDEPLIHPDHIRKVKRLFTPEEPMTITTCACVTDLPEDLDSRSNAFVALGEHSNALYFSRYPIPYAGYNHWRKHVQYYKHIGIYGFSPNALKAYYFMKSTRLQKLEGLEQLKWLENGQKIKCGVSEHATVGVDTIDDLSKVKHIIDFGYAKKKV